MTAAVAPRREMWAYLAERTGVSADSIAEPGEADVGGEVEGDSARERFGMLCEDKR